MKHAYALVIALSLAAVPAVAHCGSCTAGSAHADTAHAKADIVQTAASAGSFNTLIAAVKAAGLVETLQSDGPFTVFAPTDEAFAKLPEGTVEALLEQPEQLRAILLYHVVPGSVSSSQVVNLDKATTAQGSDVRIKVADGNVMINEARVVTPDIETSNGVIHVIDTVILPQS